MFALALQSVLLQISACASYADYCCAVTYLNHIVHFYCFYNLKTVGLITH